MLYWSFYDSQFDLYHHSLSESFQYREVTLGEVAGVFSCCWVVIKKMWCSPKESLCLPPAPDVDSANRVADLGLVPSTRRFLPIPNVTPSIQLFYMYL